MVFEGGLLEERLPFLDGGQPFLGILKAELGLSQVLFLLGHGRVVVCPFLKVFLEDLGPGHRHLLATALDLFIPVNGSLFLEPAQGAPDLGIDGPQSTQGIFAVERSATRKSLSDSTERTEACELMGEALAARQAGSLPRAWT